MEHLRKRSMALKATNQVTKFSVVIVIYATLSLVSGCSSSSDGGSLKNLPTHVQPAGPLKRPVKGAAMPGGGPPMAPPNPKQKGD